jgi:dolichyl-phosphate beta-glucosyltransferase
MSSSLDQEFGVEDRSSLDPNYSIVIPAYNESARLGNTLESVLAYIHGQGWNAEVIVVNDGSTDNTTEIVLSFAAKDTALRLVENPGNHGKGYSVRNGMLHARGQVVLFSDADLSSPIEEARKLLEALDAGADIAIGSRWLRAETQTKRQPLHRQIFGRIFNLLLRSTLGLQFRDTQCGFKAFKQPVVKAIFPLQKIERWGFDPEFWRESSDSKSRRSPCSGATVEVPASIRWSTALACLLTCCTSAGTISWGNMNYPARPAPKQPAPSKEAAPGTCKKGSIAAFRVGVRTVSFKPEM